MIAHWFPYTRLRREQNCTRFTAFSLALIQGLGWIFLRLESPSWKALREQHRRLYPHLAEKRSSIGDPLRYVVQTLWLLLIRTPNLDQIGRQRFRQRHHITHTEIKPLPGNRMQRLRGITYQRQSVRYRSRSGGQRQRIDATCTCLRDLP